MAIKLKTKVALGGIFLFLLLILVGALSFYYFNRIADEAKDIVKDNYETLTYSKEMLNELDALYGNNTDAINKFEKSLAAQERNITEPGEKELTDSLRSHFEGLKKQKSKDSLGSMIRKNIGGIMQLNLQAINKKNEAAKNSAEKAKAIITIIITICVLIGFTFVFNFPSLVASPIAKLTAGIQAIAGKNYKERIHLNRKDEFGQLANAFNSMAEKLDEFEHSNLSKLLYEKKRAETVINSLKDASIGIDNKGEILFANEQALQLLHLKELEIVGHLQSDVQKKNDLFRFLINEPNSMPFKIIVEGKENYFSKEIIDIKQGNEKAGNVIVLKNITSFKELDVAKTNFIATISHELKTPLASSDFSLKLLEDERIGKLSNEQRDLLNNLKQDNQRMLRILSELLNMAQVETGKIHLELSEVNPEVIMNNAINLVATTVKEKNITIQTEYDCGNARVKVDREKTGWVLNNFLTNATKHAPPDSIIHANIIKSEKGIEFSVKDQGPGIALEYLPKVFERFFKVPGSKVGGTGLGLSISKEFIESQGGQIWVKSEIGKGACFGFTLPVANRSNGSSN